MLVSIFVLSILVIDVAYSYKSSPKYTPSSRSKLSLDAGKKAIPVEASKLVLDAHSAKQIEVCCVLCTDKRKKRTLYMLLFRFFPVL